MDILGDILQAYYNDIAARQQGELHEIASCYIMQSPALLPPDWAAPFPCVLIWPGPVPVEPVHLSGNLNQKQYTITLTLLKEGGYNETQGLFSDTFSTGLMDIVTLFERLYGRETFELSWQAWCSKLDYTLKAIAPFRGLNQAHLTFIHKYRDNGQLT